MNAQVVELTLIVAQETDQTGRRITTLIVALVAVALLLGLLTAWYWRHTNPYRRAQLQADARQAALEQEEQRRAEVGEPAGSRAVASVGGGASAPAIEPRRDPVWADEVAAGGAERGADDDGLSADEWLRLTGPDAVRPRTNPSTNDRPQGGAAQPRPEHPQRQAGERRPDGRT